MPGEGRRAGGRYDHRDAVAAAMAAVVGLLLLAPGPAHGARRTLEGVVRTLAADTVDQSANPKVFAGPSKDVYRKVLVVGNRAYFLKGGAVRLLPNMRVRAQGELSGRTFEPAASATLGSVPAPPPTGTTRVLVMLAHWSAPDHVTQAGAREQMFTDSNAWYRDASYGKLGQTGDVTPWMRIAGPSRGCYGEHMTIMSQARSAAQALGYDVAGYDNFVVYFPRCGGDATGVAGWAYVGSEGTWLNGYMDRRVTVHEEGHNYGLRHSHSHLCSEGGLSGTCHFSDYGDPYDAMGSSGAVGHFNAHQKMLLGWMDGRTVDLSAGGSATLAPLATQSLSAKAARIVASSGRTYWLEYRQAIGFDSAISQDGSDGVLLHVAGTGSGSPDTAANLLDVRPGDGISAYSATLGPGLCWRSPEGLRFSVGSATSTAATVTVSTATTGCNRLSVFAGGSGSGAGRVTSAPAGISCQTSCTGSFTGSSVTLTANPDAGSSFTGWSGACAGTNATCTVTMGADRTVTASFGGPPCPDAAFEPDDTPGQARTVPVGSTETHSLCRAGDADWVSFTGTAGSPLRLQTLDLAPGADTVMDLYQADGTTLIASDDDSDGTLASRLDFTPAATATYLLKVRHSSADAYGAAMTYDLRISNSDTTAPAWTARSPSGGGTSAAVAGNVTATFSEEVQGVSASTFALENAATHAAVAAAVRRDGSTNRWILDPSTDLAPDTRYTATLTGGPAAIRDLAGNSLVTTTWTFTTGPSPSVTAFTPATNSSGNAVARTVTATFSEAMRNVTASTFTLENAATGATVGASVTRNGTTNQWILDPSADLAADTRYTATVAATVRDLAGNPMVAAVRWSFVTGPRPVVTARTPAGGATGVARAGTVTATFSEPVLGVTATTFTLRNAATGAAVAAAVRRNGTTNQWILDPDAVLAANTRYTATLTGGSSAIRDSAANLLASTSWSFTTGA